MILELGVKVMEVPSVLADKFHYDSNECKAQEGTVVYINKKHRYYTVEFKTPGGSYCESFKIYKRRKAKTDG